MINILQKFTNIKMTGLRLKITPEFEKEAESVAAITRDLKFQQELHVKRLLEKARENNWYEGPDAVFEELLYEFCDNTRTQRSWKNFSGAITKED